MADILEQLITKLEEFNGVVEQSVEAVRRSHEAVSNLRDEIFNDVQHGGHYIRDNKALILSAPQIIIGNVDRFGNLMGSSGSKVVLRTNDLSLEATGSEQIGGKITSRAASIKQIAVDPGLDGQSNMVCKNTSEIVNQARGIVLATSSDEGAFVYSPNGGEGITLSTDKNIQLKATPSLKTKGDEINEQIKQLDEKITLLKTDCTQKKASVTKWLNGLRDKLQEQFKYNESDEDIRIDYLDMARLQADYNELQSEAVRRVVSFVNSVSELAALNYRKSALNAIKTKLPQAEAFKEDNGSKICIESEAMSIRSVDGDGELREGKKANLDIQVPHINLRTVNALGKFIDNSEININTRKFNLSTTNFYQKDEENNHPEKHVNENGSGIIINSGNISIQAVDKEITTEKTTETLTKDSKFSVRMENFNVSNTTTEGAPTGRIDLNAKDVSIAALETTEQEGNKKQQVAKETKVRILAKDIHLGSTEEANSAEKVQLAASEVGIFGKKAVEMQNPVSDENKSVVTLNGGNLTAGGGNVELNGKTAITITGKTAIKSDTTMTKLTSDTVEVEKLFKSPNISDGTGGESKGADGQVKAEMKEEQVGQNQPGQNQPADK